MRKFVLEVSPMKFTAFMIQILVGTSVVQLLVRRTNPLLHVNFLLLIASFPVILYDVSCMNLESFVILWFMKFILYSTLAWFTFLVGWNIITIFNMLGVYWAGLLLFFFIQNDDNEQQY